jgi:hypothetical protein
MNITPLLDFIAEHESEGAARRLGISAYDIVWGKISREHRPASLRSMTVGQVLAWQDRIDPLYRSEAAGRYQMMEDTLRGLYAKAGMTLESRFDEDGQDQLAKALLRRRGLDRYLAGKISTETFCNNLAHEWASLPMVSGPKKGRSAYDGDGLNKAGVDVAPFIAAVEAIKTTPATNVQKVHSATPASPWSAIINAIIAIFGKGRK